MEICTTEGGRERRRKGKAGEEENERKERGEREGAACQTCQDAHATEGARVRRAVHAHSTQRHANEDHVGIGRRAQARPPKTH